MASATALNVVWGQSLKLHLLALLIQSLENFFAKKMLFLIQIMIILVNYKDYLYYFSYSGLDIFDLSNKQHFFDFFFKAL